MSTDTTESVFERERARDNQAAPSHAIVRGGP